MNNKMFDPTKPVQTRDGRPARILCSNLKAPGLPIVAAVSTSTGSENIFCFRADGTRDYELDLVNVPEKITERVWANVYRGGLPTCFHTSREAADAEQSLSSECRRLACVEVIIEATEGQGL